MQALPLPPALLGWHVRVTDPAMRAHDAHIVKTFTFTDPSEAWDCALEAVRAEMKVTVRKVVRHG